MWYTASHCCWTGLTMRFFCGHKSHTSFYRTLCRKKKQQHKNDNFAAGTSTPSSRCTLLFYNKFFEVPMIATTIILLVPNKQEINWQAKRILEKIILIDSATRHHHHHVLVTSQRTRSFISSFVRYNRRTTQVATAAAAATATTGCFPLDKMAAAAATRCQDQQ